MVVETVIFGPIDVDAQNIFELPTGLFGFDTVHKYALIRKEEDDVVLQWFQAVDASVPCFVVFDPTMIVDGYHPQVEKSDLKALGCQDASELDFIVIAVVPEDISRTTVNLKSPIALNRKSQIARQVILANQDYPIKFSLVEEPVHAQIS